jgi:hypothetical protein
MEYAYVAYFIKTLIPYINSFHIDTAEKIRREKLLIRKMSKRFPD